MGGRGPPIFLDLCSKNPVDVFDSLHVFPPKILGKKVSLRYYISEKDEDDSKYVGIGSDDVF